MGMPMGLTSEESVKLRTMLEASPTVTRDEAAQINFAAPPQDAAASNFSQLWEEGLGELQKQEEQLLYVLSMTQERTRPRKGGLPENFDEAWKSTLKEEDQNLCAVEQAVQDPSDPDAVRRAL